MGKVMVMLPRYLVEAMRFLIWPSRYSVSQLVTVRSIVMLILRLIGVS